MRSSFLAVAALANIGAAVVATSKNHEMEKDFAGLFGPPRRRETSMGKEDSLDKSMRGHGRQVQEESEVPPSEEDNDLPFYTAETLDYFKNDMPSNFFKWVNPEEILPGATTCGFLHPYLGTTLDVSYPQIEVYVCMRFANIQPATKGNVFVHCGGPSTLSDCHMATVLGAKVLDDYNFLTIDQRGMGRSKPTFAHAECSIYDYQEVNGTLEAYNPPEFMSETDYSDINSVKLRLEPSKRRVFSCWQCEDCDFLLNATQGDGSVKTFHFLEYSGTRQLAEDIERIRVLLNAPVMHVYGISYGTSVFGTYATLFPQKVGIFVLDGNVNPFPDLEYIAWTLGRGIDTRINYGIYSCSAKNAEKPGSCPVDDLPKCISDLNAVLATDGVPSGPGRQASLTGILSIMFQKRDVAEEICTVAANGDSAQLENIYMEFVPPDVEARKKQMTGDRASQPTDKKNVYGNPDYAILMAHAIPSTMVQAQDDFSALYDADYFAKKIVEFAYLHPGAGSGAPVQTFFHEWAQGFYWPKGVPLSPLGNPSLTGIVAGQLYDENTPYVWTQNMRNSFQNTSLLTSQDTEHGLTAIEPACQQHIINYFETGIVQIVDGTVCGADFADDSVLTEAFPIG